MPATAALRTEAIPLFRSGSALRQEFQHAGERVLDRLPAHRLAVAREVTRFGARGAPGGGPGEAHGPHRLFGAAARGARNAGHGERDAGMAMGERAERHLLGDRLAHGAVARKRLAFHAEHLLLGGIGIGDEAALEPGRRAGLRGELLRYPAA